MGTGTGTGPSAIGPIGLPYHGISKITGTSTVVITNLNILNRDEGKK